MGRPRRCTPTASVSRRVRRSCSRSITTRSTTRSSRGCAMPASPTPRSSISPFVSAAGSRLGRTLHVLGIDEACQLPGVNPASGPLPSRSVCAMGDLAVDTHVEGADGEYLAELSRDWEIWGPNGGYIASIALRGAGAHSRFERPATLVGHFLGVATFEAPLEIRATTLRAAKRAESIRVELTQGEQRIFEALVWAVGDVDGLTHDTTRMPTAPDPDDIVPVSERLAGREAGPYQRFWSNFDERVPDDVWIDDWENRQPTEPTAGHWFRYVPTATFDDPWVDACRSVILLDTLGWPAVCRCIRATSTWRRASTSRVRFIGRVRANRGCGHRCTRRVRPAGCSAPKDACGRATARCSRSAPANCCAARCPARSVRGVEDRLTPALYLEMTDRPLDAYVDARVSEVVARSGVQRATWWRNVRARPRRPASCPPRVRPSRGVRSRRRRSPRPQHLRTSTVTTSCAHRGPGKASSPGGRQSGCHSY